VGNLAPRTTPHSLTPIISSQVPARESDTNSQRDRILDLLFRQRLHAMKLMRLSRLPTCMQPAQRASEPCPEVQKPIGLRVPRLKRTLTMVHLQLRKTPDTGTVLLEWTELDRRCTPWTWQGGLRAGCQGPSGYGRTG
jgi:hypothetical protein